MKIFYYAAVCLLLLASCKKEVTELPPATQTGANTFGAIVNGNLWVPEGFGSIPSSRLLEARWVDNDLYIQARNFASEPNEKEFALFVKDVTGPGTYQLNLDANYPSGGESFGYYVKRNVTPQNEWITSPAHTGTITITKIDNTNHFVSGTFEFTPGSLYNSDPLVVTDGRFDVRTL